MDDSWYTSPFAVSVGGSRGDNLFWNVGAGWEQRANVLDGLS